MSEHACRCFVCSPGAFPSGPQRRPDHIAVRFGTAEHAGHPGHPQWAIALDGELVPGVVEALPGREGYVVFNTPCTPEEDERLPPHSVHAHVCRACGEKVCNSIRYGRVVTWLVPWIGDAEERARIARELMPKGAE